MATQPLTMFSVEWRDERIYAIVPEYPSEALARLKRDDPIWEKPDVYRHWFHKVDMDRAHVRVRDRIKFWVGR